MKPWSYWFPDLIPHVPGVPEVLAEHELRRSAQAFFSQTKAWRVVQPARPVSAGAREISAGPDDDDQALVGVDAAWYDNRQILPTAPEVLDAGYGQDWLSHEGSPTSYYQVQPGVLCLYPAPMNDSGAGLKLRLVVMPSDQSPGLPEDIAIKYRDEIQAGAKSRLMLYPGKPWSNPDLAAVYGQAFKALADQAAVSAAHAFVQARIPSKVRWC